MASLSANLKLMNLIYGEQAAYGYTNYGDLYDANLEFIEDALTEGSDITVTTADITLDDDQQRSLHLNLSGALTGNRNIVLKATQKGFWFVTNGTSGAYTITIKPSAGSGFVLDQGKRAWVYSDGSTAIQIMRPGDLMACEAVSSDADFTLTWNSNAETIRHTGTLTADRAVTLSTTGAVKGARWRIARTGSGAFNLNVGTGPLRALRQNMWAEFVYDGSAWYLERSGAISTLFGSNGIQVRTAADTFTGRTISGTANEVEVSNGDGISGDPTLGLPDDITVTTSLTVPTINLSNTGLKIKDTNGSHNLVLKPGSDITAERTVTIVTGDSDRTLDLTTIASAFDSKLLHVVDEKASGTAGGAASATTWNQRTLNTVRTNEISGASVASNQISLPSGTYFILASSTVHGTQVSGNKMRLYNVTDGTTILQGQSGSFDSTMSVLSGRFTISATKTVEIDHYTTSARVSDGLGPAAGAGANEVYTNVMIWKIA